MLRNKLRLSAAAVSLVLSVIAFGQGIDPAASPEFRINSFEDDDQRIPLVDSDTSGRSVVIWQSRGQDAPGWSIFAQRLDQDSEFLGGEFRINDYNIGSQDGQSLIVTPSGEFAVAWNGADRRSMIDVVSLRRFNAQGQPLAGDRRISADTGSVQLLPRLGLASDNELVISWEADSPGSGFDILTRRADDTGAASAPIELLNTETAGAQRRGDVAAAANGEVFAVWQDAVQDGSDWGIFLRCLDAQGQGQVERQVNQSTTGQQLRPRIARAVDGRTAVVWQDTTGLSSFVYRRIMARVFDANCEPLSEEMQVNQFDDGLQDQPTLSVDAFGNFIIAWQSFPDDFELQGIYARRLGRDGEFLSEEFKISQEIEAFQDFPAVTGLPDGGYLFVWESAGQDESGFGIYARRFDGPTASTLDIISGVDQAAETNTLFANELVIEIRDQWGQPRSGELVRVSSPDGRAGLVFSNGQSSIDLATNASGRLQIELRANGVAGRYQVRVEVLDNGIEESFGLENIAGADAFQTIPVPLLHPSALLLLCFLIVILVRGRL